MCAGTGRKRGAGLADGSGWSLWDVDHQVIVPIQGVIPAACIAEHLPRDGAQDRVGGHLGRGQGGQGCPDPSPRTPGREGQWPAHRAVRGSHRHLQQGKKHREGLSEALLLEAAWGQERVWAQPPASAGVRGLPLFVPSVSNQQVPVGEGQQWKHDDRVGGACDKKQGRKGCALPSPGGSLVILQQQF